MHYWKSSMFLLLLGAAARAQEPSPQQPSPTPAPAGATQSAEPQTGLPRESPVENALGRTTAMSGSAFGGYGELTYNDPNNGPGVVDLRRFVLYFGHDFSERLRFYSEVEVEHAVSSADDQGEVEIEQAYLDGLLHKKINLRGGVILMPVGIINIYHEPPSFNGVDRPDVDQFVIPTTWREAGAGIFGELAEGLRYQLYGVTAFNANGFTADAAIREGHQEAQLAYAGDFGGVARLDYEPVLGTVFGVSAYGATSGNTLRSSVGRVPVAMFEADVRTRWQGFTARAEVAGLFVGDAGPLNQALAAGSPEQQEALPISSSAWGGYLEVGYDLLRLLAPSERQSLTAFTRAEYVDTQADVPAGFDARLEFRRYSAVAGLVYRPIPQVALKADYRRREFGEGPGHSEIAAAITWLF
ncbi:MAG: hypothetical protein ACJ79D_10885 [Myxococcales bacterium]